MCEMPVFQMKSQSPGNASKDKTSYRKHKGLKGLHCVYKHGHTILFRHKPACWQSPAECKVVGHPHTDELRDFLKLH